MVHSSHDREDCSVQLVLGKRSNGLSPLWFRWAWTVLPIGRPPYLNWPVGLWRLSEGCPELHQHQNQPDDDLFHKYVFLLDSMHINQSPKVENQNIDWSRHCSGITQQVHAMYFSLTKSWCNLVNVMRCLISVNWCNAWWYIFVHVSSMHLTI